MAGEDHAVEVVAFALEPVGTGNTSMIDGTLVVSSAVCAQADTRVQRRRQHVIDHVEALLRRPDNHRRHVDKS